MKPMAGQGGQPAESLAAAAAYGEPLFGEVQHKCSHLKRLAEVMRAPTSWADAQAAVQARDEEKRKREQLRKDASKSKGAKALPETNLLQNTPQPGLVIGSVADASAFWMFVEDYFRDVAYEDLMLLVPHCRDITQDEDLYVPQLGREASAAAKQDDKTPANAGRAAKVNSRSALAMMEAVDLDMNERRSSRLGGRLNPADDFARLSSLEQLAHGYQPTGMRSQTMLQACTDTELSALVGLLHKLGLLSPNPQDPAQVKQQLGALAAEAGQFMKQYTPLPALAQLPMQVNSRADLEQTLLSVSSLMGVACSSASQQPATEQGQGTPGPAVALAAAQQAAQEQHANGVPIGAGTEVNGTPPRRQQHRPHTCMLAGLLTEQAEYMHPYTQLILAQAPSAYVLDPVSQTLPDEVEADEAAPGAAPAGALPPAGIKQFTMSTTGAKRGRPSKTSKKVAFNTATTPTTAGAPAPVASTGPAATASEGTAGVTVNKTVASSHQADADSAAAQSREEGVVGGGDAGGEGGRLKSSRLSQTQLATAAESGLTSAGGSAGVAQVKPDGDDEASKVPVVVATPAPGAATAPAPTGSLPLLSQPLVQQGPRKRGPKPRHSNLTGAAAAAVAKAAAKQGQVHREAVTTPLAAAVSAYCAAGGPEECLDQQWSDMDEVTDLIACAPDDEVLTEILALQSELVQQVAINRRRVACLVQRVVDDLPGQEVKADERKCLEADMRGYIQRKAEIRRLQKREQQLMRKAQALDTSSLLPGAAGLAARNRSRARKDGTLGSEPASGDGMSREATPDLTVLLEGAGPMEDPYAQRTGEEEALCAVCGDGSSQDGNEILFCERCDVAVHQDCYGLAMIPEGEWLCWPCQEYEKQLASEGKSASDIRPPRWEMAARGLQAGQLGGGSVDARCALCPIKRGAFKRTQEGKDWVHVVCALWHAETDVLPGPHNEVVVGVSQIKADRWQSPCQVCNTTAGATMRCSYGQCNNSFHPLCGRRIGNYLCTKANSTMTKLIYRGYCHQHTPIVQERDAQDVNPAQAAVDIRRPEIRKEVQASRPRKDKAAAGAGAGAGPGRPAGTTSGARAGYDDGSLTASSGRLPDSTGYAKPGPRPVGRPPKNAPPPAQQPRPRGRPPGSGSVKAAAAANAAAAAAAAAGLAAGGDLSGLIAAGDYAETAKEQEAELLQRVRWELESVRNMLTIVVRREKQSRAVSRLLSDMHTSRTQDPQAALAALLAAQGPEAMANLPAAGTQALEAAQAWWAAQQQALQDQPGGMSGLASAIQSLDQSALVQGVQGQQDDVGTQPGTSTTASNASKRKRDGVVPAHSKDIAMQQQFMTGVGAPGQPAGVAPGAKAGAGGHKKKQKTGQGAPGPVMADPMLIASPPATFLAPPPAAYDAKQHGKRQKQTGKAGGAPTLHQQQLVMPSLPSPQVLMPPPSLPADQPRTRAGRARNPSARAIEASGGTPMQSSGGGTRKRSQSGTSLSPGLDTSGFLAPQSRTPGLAMTPVSFSGADDDALASLLDAGPDALAAEFFDSAADAMLLPMGLDGGGYMGQEGVGGYNGYGDMGLLGGSQGGGYQGGGGSMMLGQGQGYAQQQQQQQQAPPQPAQPPPNTRTTRGWANRTS